MEPKDLRIPVLTPPLPGSPGQELSDTAEQIVLDGAACARAGNGARPDVYVLHLYCISEEDV